MGASRVVCLSEQLGPYGDAVRALGYPLSIIARVGGFDVGRWLALRRLFRRSGRRHPRRELVRERLLGPRAIRARHRLSAVSATATCRPVVPVNRRFRRSSAAPHSVLVNSERGRNW